MERRTALALATAAAGTVMAASAAFAANVGLLQDDAKPVGVLDTTSLEETTSTTAPDPTVVTVIVEDPPVAVAPAAGLAPAASADAPQVVQSYDDTYDDEYDGSEHDDDDEHDDDGFDEHDDDDD